MYTNNNNNKTRKKKWVHIIINNTRSTYNISTTGSAVRSNYIYISICQHINIFIYRWKTRINLKKKWIKISVYNDVGNGNFGILYIYTRIRIYECLFELIENRPREETGRVFEYFNPILLQLRSYVYIFMPKNLTRSTIRPIIAWFFFLCCRVEKFESQHEIVVVLFFRDEKKNLIENILFVCFVWTVHTHTYAR